MLANTCLADNLSTLSTFNWGKLQLLNVDFFVYIKLSTFLCKLCSNAQFQRLPAVFGESQIEAATRFYVVAKELNFAKKLVVAKHFGLCVHRKGTVDFYELLRCRNNLHNNLLILNLPKAMPKTNSDCHNVAIIFPAENILGQVFCTMQNGDDTYATTANQTMTTRTQPSLIIMHN